MCYHCCFTKQWMWLTTCCHCPLSKNSVFGFPFVFAAHLISSEWFSIRVSLLCFKNQWMQFFLCYQGTFSKQWINFQILSLLSFKEQGIRHSLWYHHTFNKQWMLFHMLSLLLHLAVEVIFPMFSLLFFKKQWIQFLWHCLFSKQSIEFHKCCHCRLAKEWIWFFACCHCLFSKSNAWFFMHCHCTFNQQWIDIHMLSVLFH